MRMPTKSKPKRREWNMVAIEGKEYRRFKRLYDEGKITQQEFLKEYRNPDNYRPGDPSASRSRRFDSKKKSGAIYDELYLCIFRKQYYKYLSLIDAIDINECDEYERNLLDYSIVEETDDISKDLIERGIDINKQDYIGYAPLHFCADHNNCEIAEMLLKKGANVNAANKYGNNPLLYAAFRREFELVSLLLSYGADINQTNNFGRSPLSFAEQCGDVEMMEFLVKHEHNLSTKNTMEL